MNNKIGIMTWFTYENYGTVLQAYALNRLLVDNGYDVKDIYYDPTAGQKKLRRNRSLASKLSDKFRALLGWRTLDCSSKGIERSVLFKDFVRDYIPHTEIAKDESDLASIADGFDAAICGSDQIWSPLNFDSHYFLDFVPEDCLKVAYAPSFGKNDIPSEMKDSYHQLLTRFDSLSVRESSGAKIVSSITGETPPVVLDPTLLLRKADWQELSSPCDKKENYAVLYFLGDYKKNESVALRLSCELGLDVVQIPVFERDLRKSSSFNRPVGPIQFVSLIANASAVFTDSFHGLVFASIFNKPVFSFERFEPLAKNCQNTRIYNFLSLAGLESSLVSRDKLEQYSLDDYRDIDYKLVNEKLDNLRVESIEYLLHSLSPLA